MVVNLKTALLLSELQKRDGAKKKDSNATVPVHKMSPEEKWIRSIKNNGEEIVEEIERKNPGCFDVE